MLVYCPSQMSLDVSVLTFTDIIRKTSDPVIVDYTPPTKSDKPIYLPGRHITSVQEIEAW
jgi:hypothetical protein